MNERSRPEGRLSEITTTTRDQHQPTPADVWRAVMAAPLDDIVKALDPQAFIVGQRRFTCPVCRPLADHWTGFKRRPHATIHSEWRWVCEGVDDGLPYTSRRVRKCDGGTGFLLRRLVLEGREALDRFLAASREEAA